jgi:OmpA-OmpF porin, OOP family
MKNQNLPLAILSTIGLMACSHGVTPYKYSETANPLSEITNQEQKIQEAQDHQIDVFSPKYFHKASNSLKKAKKQQQKGDSSEDVLQTLGEAKANLDQAFTEGEKAKEFLPNIASARYATQETDLTDMTDELGDIDSDLKSITESLEDSQKANAEVRSRIAEQYSLLELKSITKKKLSDVENMINQAEQKNAKDITPEALLVAKNDYKAAQNVIKSDRHSDGKINNAVSKARKSSSLLLKLLASEQISREQSPETRAKILEEYNANEKLANAELQKSERMIDNKNQSLRTAWGENSTLRREQSDDLIVQNAMSEFKKDEADVYRQNGNIIIRLKSMAFASGRSDLPASSISVLEKVKSVIQDLGPGNVIVEGHTDAIGNAKNNTILSMERADAVAKFFSVDQELHNHHFQTAGFGYSKPISTNKTSQGRAQNRRVDIIIRSQQTI